MAQCILKFEDYALLKFLVEMRHIIIILYYSDSSDRIRNILKLFYVVKHIPDVLKCTLGSNVTFRESQLYDVTVRMLHLYHLCSDYDVTGTLCRLVRV